MKHLISSTLVMLSLIAYVRAEGWVNYSSFEEISDLLEHDGQVYLASLGGLAVWNPETNEKTYYNRGNSLIYGNNLIDIELGGDGKIWLSFTDGIQSFDQGQFSNVIPTLGASLAKPRDASEIIVFADRQRLNILKQNGTLLSVEFPEIQYPRIPLVETDLQTGRIYVARNNLYEECTVYILDEQELVPQSEGGYYTVIADLEGMALLPDSQGGCWFITNNRISHLLDGVWDGWDTEQHLGSLNYVPVSAAKSETGAIQLISHIDDQAVIHQYSGGVWTQEDVPQLTAEAVLSGLYQLDSGLHIAASENDGIFRLEGQLGTKIALKQSCLASNTITLIEPYDEGMLVVDGSELRYFYEEDCAVMSDISGFPDNPQHFAFGEDQMWVSSEDQIFTLVDRVLWEPRQLEVELGNSLEKMDVAPTGELWLLTHEGIFRYDGVVTEQILIPDMEFQPTYLDLQLMENGDIWLLSYQSISHYDKSEEAWTHHQFLVNTFENTVKLAVDDDGVAWVLSSVKLSSIEDGIQTHYTLLDQNWHNTMDSDLHIDRFGNKWISARDQVSVWNEGNIAQYKRSNSCLPEGPYPTMAEDQFGNIWVGSSVAGLSIIANSLSLSAENPSPAATSNMDLQVCPNPASRSGSIIVSWLEQGKNPQRISLLDLQGRELYSESILPAEEGGKFSMRAPSDLQGLFLLRIEFEESAATSKLMLQ